MSAASRFYVTTPIYYVSDVPHLGHAYTTVVADTIARYQRMRLGAANVRFLTGTDEHGQKIERLAALQGKAPQAFVDDFAATYVAMWNKLHVANDDFIRTTDADHQIVVAELWKKMEANGDIYLRPYQGWYCVACETFYTDKELAPGNLCAVHKRPVERVEEENYFFRLSAYQKRLQDFYDGVLRDTGRPFVEPPTRMNEVRSFVDGGLEDFSISRTNFEWGLKVPGDARHVIYVWLDALTNYYTATRRASLDGFWAEGVDIVHLMGKEITRFHAIYWPAMLMSAGLRPPSRIVAHGWWTVDGEKMGKTLGNVVDPGRLIADLDAATGAPVGADAFRYFVMREVPLGLDGDFSHGALLGRYNAELANDLGNLLNRNMGMIGKYLGEVVTWRSTDEEIRKSCEDALKSWHEAMQAFQPSKALEAIWQLVRKGNEFIESSAPWKQRKPDQEVTLWNVLELYYFISHMVAPFMPERAEAMRKQLGLDEPAQLPVWREGRAYRVAPAGPLFPRLDEDHRKELLAKWLPVPLKPPAAAQQISPATHQSGTATQHSASPIATQHSGTATQHSAASAVAAPPIEFADFAKLDLRVAAITAAERVPKKDKLLKLTIDLGSEQRQVVAGIGSAYAPETLVGRKVIFLANLKRAKIGGVVSEGMILAAGEAEILGLSALDRDCPLGTKVR